MMKRLTLNVNLAETKKAKEELASISALLIEADERIERHQEETELLRAETRAILKNLERQRVFAREEKPK